MTRLRGRAGADEQAAPTREQDGPGSDRNMIADKGIKWQRPRPEEQPVGAAVALCRSGVVPSGVVP
ncbi:hypothetical protein [Streptomyces sp. NPDC054765]